MSVVDVLRSVVAHTPPRTSRCQRCGRPVAVVCECRTCGTTVETGADACPTCGDEAIAEFEIH